MRIRKTARADVYFSHTPSLTEKKKSAKLLAQRFQCRLRSDSKPGHRVSAEAFLVQILAQAFPTLSLYR
jgi:hypothetical protein